MQLIALAYCLDPSAFGWPIDATEHVTLSKLPGKAKNPGLVHACSRSNLISGGSIAIRGSFFSLR